MAGNRTAVAALERNWQMVTSAVAEVDEATMAARPNDDSNSMSWLIWHMTRVADRFINFRLKAQPQIWTTGAWHEKFGMAANPDDFGMGWDNQQVADWQTPAKAVVMDYFNTVNAAVADYMGSMSDADLAREIPFPAAPDTLPAGEALSILVWDNIVHGGQVAYLRGYFRGMGWHR